MKIDSFRTALPDGKLDIKVISEQMKGIPSFEMSKIAYSTLAILAIIVISQVQSAVLPVSSKEVALVTSSPSSSSSETSIDTLGSSRIKRQGGCGCCGCGCGCCGCGGGGGGGYVAVAVVAVVLAAVLAVVPDVVLVVVHVVVDVDVDVVDVEEEDVSVVLYRIFELTKPTELLESREDQLRLETSVDFFPDLERNQHLSPPLVGLLLIPRALLASSIRRFCRERRLRPPPHPQHPHPHPQQHGRQQVQHLVQQQKLTEARKTCQSATEKKEYLGLQQQHPHPPPPPPPHPQHPHPHPQQPHPPCEDDEGEDVTKATSFDETGNTAD
ncbi:hypothetical protein GCK72_005951 [Caenorhabditis remanei]|uniref:Uncharacterized protein n=1 Tax=Caenorhabditis remanei TaxID=31234 RepID=A0A6A5HGZ8_CAERE|nr:hypothetical protein GCK72_005951 [Caenorhabditis remanei]KAF1765996.1 hypothetical protein GCK72_005951 [Caenorhabditis remanei]